MRSSSTGTPLSGSAMSAPSSITGPPVYAGPSWTKRSATSVGVTIAAVASAGTLCSPPYSISTRTELPSGITAVTLPTLTPRIRTSVPL